MRFNLNGKDFEFTVGPVDYLGSSAAELLVKKAAEGIACMLFKEIGASVLEPRFRYNV